MALLLSAFVIYGELFSSPFRRCLAWNESEESKATQRVHYKYK